MARPRLGQAGRVPARAARAPRGGRGAAARGRPRLRGRRRRSLPACPTRARPFGTTSCAVRSTCRTRRSRTRAAPLRRAADVQLRLTPLTTGTTGSPMSCGARTTHQHPEADPDPRGARRDRPALRAPAERPRPGRAQAIEAPRRRLGRGVSRARIRPRGARQLPRAARLEPRRRDDGHPARRARPPLHARPRRASPATFDYPKLNVAERRLPAGGKPLRGYAGPARRVLARGRVRGQEATIRAAAPLVQEKIATLGEFPAFAGFLFAPVEPDPEQLGGAGPILEEASRAGRRRAVRAEADRDGAPRDSGRLEVKPRQAFAPVRLAVTGSKVSPGLFESIALLGREETLAAWRLRSLPDLPEHSARPQRRSSAAAGRSRARRLNSAVGAAGRRVRCSAGAGSCRPVHRSSSFPPVPSVCVVHRINVGLPAGLRAEEHEAAAEEREPGRPEGPRGRTAPAVKSSAPTITSAVATPRTDASCGSGAAAGTARRRVEAACARAHAAGEPHAGRARRATRAAASRPARRRDSSTARRRRRSCPARLPERLDQAPRAPALPGAGDGGRARARRPVQRVLEAEGALRARP